MAGKNQCQQDGKLHVFFSTTKRFVLSIINMIKKSIKWIREKSKTESGWKIIHWCLFCVGLSLVPLILAIWQDQTTIELTLDEIKSKYSTDFLLVVFAIAVNLAACTVSFLGRTKIKSLATSIITMLICLSHYTHLHNLKTDLLPGAINSIYDFIIVALILNTIVGIVLQTIPEEPRK